MYYLRGNILISSNPSVRFQRKRFSALDCGRTGQYRSCGLIRFPQIAQCIYSRTIMISRLYNSLNLHIFLSSEACFFKTLHQKNRGRFSVTFPCLFSSSGTKSRPFPAESHPHLLAGVSTTMISSIVTPKTAARMTKLSMVGIAVPWIHL